jgi:hypothetical protein
MLVLTDPDDQRKAALPAHLDRLSSIAALRLQALRCHHIVITADEH